MSTMHSDDLPSIAGVLAPVVARFPRQQQKLLIAWAERQAARRYQSWAEQVGGSERAGFLGCVAREKDIAARIEALDPDAAAIQQQLLAELPDLEAQVLAVYADRSLEEQWEIQRRGERAGKKPGRLPPPRRTMPRPMPCCWLAPPWKTKTRVFCVASWRSREGGRT